MVYVAVQWNVAWKFSRPTPRSVLNAAHVPQDYLLSNPDRRLIRSG